MNIVDVKVGQTYICTKSDRPWWTVGKEYNVILIKHGIPALIDDSGDIWLNFQLSNMSTDFKLKTDHSEQKYTQQQINKVIINAHRQYDNDSQRLAYIKGYFAK